MLQSTTALVRAVFQTVWLEFYQHEQVQSRQAIHSLARPSIPNHISIPSLSDCSHLPTPNCPAPESFLVWVSGDLRTPELLPVQCITSALPFATYPPYESCTPCSQSIFLGDDPDEMPFVPFADDPSFDHFEHMSHYKQLAWQGEERNHHDLDPDLQLIVAETARRLYSTHGITFAHIDETAILPLPILSQLPRRGLLHTSRQRDLPIWPGASATLPTPTTPAADDARGRLKSVAVVFCANLNCVQGYCARHLDPIPVPTAAFPTVLNLELHRMSDKPCGRDCFLLTPIESASMPVWNVRDLETLRCTLSVAPDILPCDLAVICRKPCRETFDLRRATIPDSTVSKPSESFPTPLKLPVHDSGSFSPVGPCHHAGDCTHDIKCPCVLNTAHCERNCACGPQCQQRWSGCRCNVVGPGQTCTTQRCVCVRAGRECDPERCGSCLSRDETANTCQNSAIQQGRRKNTAVKAGAKCGLGVFLTEQVQEGELIAEYVGELVFDLTTLSRDALSIHRGRNYLFGLDTVLSLDSAHAGNTMRYANHTRGSNANAIAKVWLVNGDHRIGIYALKTLKAGTEILFDYGDEFFKD